MTLAQLDSIEQWARVLIDDDDEEAGRQLLTLLKEREELTQLIARDPDGKLIVLVNTQRELEKKELLEAELRKQLYDAKQHAEKYRLDNIELKRKADSFAALLKKVEALLAMARDRITDGEVPTDLNKVAAATYEQEARAASVFLQKKGKAG